LARLHFLVAPALDLPSARDSLPMVLDLSGDMQLDLLGYGWDRKDGLSAWINTAQGSFTNQTTSIYNL
jgi:integrin alpha FG-GAP repeat containing protein 1